MMGLTNIPGGAAAGLTGHASGTVTYTSDGVTFVSGTTGALSGLAITGLAAKPKVVMLGMTVAHNAVTQPQLISWVREEDGTEAIMAAVFNVTSLNPARAYVPTGSTYTMTDDGFTFSGNGNSRPVLELSSGRDIWWEAWW